MSFNADPYKVMELVVRDPDEGVAIRCSSCGRETVPVPLDMSVEELLADQHEHIRRSHRREPSDFAGWGA